VLFVFEVLILKIGPERDKYWYRGRGRRRRRRRRRV